MTARRFSFTVLSVAMLLGASARSMAGHVVIEDIDVDEGNVTALLEQTSQYYVDAMRRLVTQRYQGEYSAIRWEDLEKAMVGNRVARAEYRFVVAGIERVRAYHAMGGEPLGILGASIFEGTTRAPTPQTPEVPADAWETGQVARASVPVPPTATERIAADAEDEGFFTGFDQVDVRARSLPAAGSVLEPFTAEGWRGELDPEFKALRHIEHDIVSGKVPRGGRIDIKVGDILCSSCTEAMHSMADTYDVDIRVTQVFRSLPSRKRDALLKEGKARVANRRLVDASTGRPLLADEALSSAREAQVRRTLSPRAMGRSFKNMSWQDRSFQLGSPPPLGERGRARNPDVEDPVPPEC